MATLEERRAYYQEGFSPRDREAALVPACEQGAAVDVQALLALGVSLVSPSGKRLAAKALNAAAAQAHSVELVRLLLEAGADPNGLDATQDAPLTWAAWYGERDTCGLLIERGARVDYMNPQKETALMKAIKAVKYQARAREVIPLLLAHKANPDGLRPDTVGPLREAIEQGLEDVAGWLLDAGATANPDFGERPPLLLAVRRSSSVAFVQRLLAAGADPNGGVARMSWYPLGEAIERDQREVARLLLAAGARLSLIPAEARAKATPEMATLLAGAS